MDGTSLTTVMFFFLPLPTCRQGFRIRCHLNSLFSNVAMLYNFESIVSVPVLEIRYSLTATSLPLSLPYPLSFIPPNGDSAAEEFPVF